MNHSFRQPLLALAAVVFVAVVVAACGQVTTSDEAQLAGGLRAVQPSTAQLVQADFCDNAEVGCPPTGAHGALAVNFVSGHAGYECKECHYVGGRLAFKPASKGGLAFLPPPAPRPSFDASLKTCSNVACHSVPAGTYSYYFPDGDGNPVLNTVPYGGGPAQTTPSWYSTGSSCAACHLNPPDAPGGGKYVWHSGFHGNQGPTGQRNQCQFCHPDATGSNGQGTAITNPALHGNGAVNVQATFSSACFGCH